jgi:hypothetical protein
LTRPPFEYLFESSAAGLQNMRLAQLELGADSRREIQKLLVEWIRAEALALLCDWLEENREELLRLAAVPRDRAEDAARLLRVEFPAMRKAKTG